MQHSIVVKSWCRRILAGIAYLHSQGYTHERLTCESIYINSNNGEIKIGDLGSKMILNYQNKFSELRLSKVVRNESPVTEKIDSYCFGLAILEIITSGIAVSKAFHSIVKILNLEKGKELIIDMISDKQLRQFLLLALHENPEERGSVQDLLHHPFLEKAHNDHQPVKIDKEIVSLILKHNKKSAKKSVTS